MGGLTARERFLGWLRDDPRSNRAIAKSVGCHPTYIGKLASGEKDLGAVGLRLAVAFERESGGRVRMSDMVDCSLTHGEPQGSLPPEAP